jgi:hypothetical protein
MMKKSVGQAKAKQSKKVKMTTKLEITHRYRSKLFFFLAFTTANVEDGRHVPWRDRRRRYVR